MSDKIEAFKLFSTLVKFDKEKVEDEVDKRLKSAYGMSQKLGQTARNLEKYVADQIQMNHRMFSGNRYLVVYRNKINREIGKIFQLTEKRSQQDFEIDNNHAVFQLSREIEQYRTQVDSLQRISDQLVQQTRHYKTEIQENQRRVKVLKEELMILTKVNIKLPMKLEATKNQLQHKRAQSRGSTMYSSSSQAFITELQIGGQPEFRQYRSLKQQLSRVKSLSLEHSTKQGALVLEQRKYEELFYRSLQSMLKIKQRSFNLQTAPCSRSSQRIRIATLHWQNFQQLSFGQILEFLKQNPEITVDLHLKIFPANTLRLEPSKQTKACIHPTLTSTQFSILRTVLAKRLIERDTNRRIVKSNMQFTNRAKKPFTYSNSPKAQ